MYSRIFTLILLLIAFKAVAQRGAAQRDLIITQAGEQIRCRIVDESSMRFGYIYVNDKGKPVRTEIFKTLISSFKYNYFPEDLSSGEKAPPANTNERTGGSPAKSPSAGVEKVEAYPLQDRESDKGSDYVSPLKGKTEFTNYLKYRIGFKGGLGNIIDDNTDKTGYGLFNEKLRRGWIYGVDAAVFLNDHIGIGVTYQSYQSRNRNSNLDFTKALGGDDYFQIRSLESKVNHKFVGPTLLGRVGMDYKTFVVATVSPGYYFYSDKGVVNQMNYAYKGGAWGGAATLGIDFLIGNNETGRDVILSFECGYNYGQLKSINPEKSWHELPIQMNRLDFTVGLRFTRFPRYLR